MLGVVCVGLGFHNAGYMGSFAFAWSSAKEQPKHFWLGQGKPSPEIQTGPLATRLGYVRGSAQSSRLALGKEVARNYLQ